jgi:hypothetical protein
MLSAVINGCIQKRVKLPEGITNIDTLRKRLVQQMRNEYEETCTNMYLFLFNNNLSEHITLNGWQDNPSILDHFRGHQHLPDATREIFRAYKDILGKFLAAAVDHDAYYPENQVGGNIYKYFERISSDGVWCGETELNFISELLNIQITTHSEVNFNLHVAGAHKKYVPNIHLHHTGAHYELLCNKNTYDTKLAIDQVSRKKEILFQQALTQQSQVTRRWWGTCPPRSVIEELERAHKDGRKEDVETIRSAILEMQEMMPRPIARPRRFGTTINMGYTYTWSPSRT